MPDRPVHTDVPVRPVRSVQLVQAARVDVLGPMAALALLPALTEVYRAAFPDEGDVGGDRFRDEQVPRHAGRDGFALAVATARLDSGGAGPGGAETGEAGRGTAGAGVVGFGYSYTGHRGEYWSDLVAGALPPEVAAEWVGGHTEVVDLAVHPDAQGRGTGRALLAALIGAAPTDRALLGTHRGDTPARRLYAGTGWVPLGEAGDTTVFGPHLRARRHVPPAELVRLAREFPPIDVTRMRAEADELFGDDRLDPPPVWTGPGGRPADPSPWHRRDGPGHQPRARHSGR